MIRVLLSSAAFVGLAVLPPSAAAQTAPPPVDPVVTPGLPSQPAAPASAGASAPEPRRTARDQATDARYKVRQMEGVLEKAVLQAALLLNQQLQSVSPELIQLTGSARARGYRLEGYGLFFDVQVPAAMRQTMGWTARLLRQRNESLQQALGALRRMATTLDGKARSDAELAVRQLELFILPPPGQPLGRPAAGSYAPAATSVPASAALPADSPPVAAQPELAAPAAEPPAADAAPPVNPLLLQNPDLAYELEVREALISAMIEWGGLLPLGQGEWLTVAARDNQDVVIPGETADVVTIIMRVRAADLAAYRGGTVTLADLRQRVEVREF
jgi:hypothetical protein